MALGIWKIGIAALSALIGISLTSTCEAAKAKEQEIVAWVILHPNRFDLTVADIRRALGKLYPGRFAADDERNFAVGDPPDLFMVHSTVPGEDGTFLITKVPAPYSRVSPFLKFIDDAQLRDLARTQCCWLQVHLLGIHSSRENSYRFLSRLLAGLAPADAAVLVDSETFAAYPLTDQMRRRLESGMMP